MTVVSSPSSVSCSSPPITTATTPPTPGTPTGCPAGRAPSRRAAAASTSSVPRMAKIHSRDWTSRVVVAADEDHRDVQGTPAAARSHPDAERRPSRARLRSRASLALLHRWPSTGSATTTTNCGRKSTALVRIRPAGVQAGVVVVEGVAGDHDVGVRARRTPAAPAELWKGLGHHPPEAVVLACAPGRAGGAAATSRPRPARTGARCLVPTSAANSEWVARRSVRCR